MTIWRIHTKASTDKGRSSVAEYCIKNSVVAIGWSLGSDCPDACSINFDQYCSLYKEKYPNAKLDNVIRLAKKLSPNDLIWLRSEGFYYIARVKDNSQWLHNPKPLINDNLDACNQVNNIDWIRIGDESEIPGGLSTAFIRGQTFQRINKPGILEYSELIYNQKSKDSYKFNRTIELNKDNFYSFISPSDCEDLLYAWLYDMSQKNYMCIPSTNKLATEKYEFVILDTKTGKHIFIQVKNGNTYLNTDDYASIVENSDNEIYLLTTRGKIENPHKHKNIHCVDPDELFNFAVDKTKCNIIPPHIRHWIEFANTSHSDTNQ